MDVKIEATAATAAVEITEAIVSVTQATVNDVFFAIVEAVASSSCPTLGSHSISAVAPDSYFERNLAVAA